jgi:hypothetical protein
MAQPRSSRLGGYTTTTALTTLLNAKVDDSQVSTNVPAGALFTDTVYTHPGSHPISMISGLQPALDAKQATLSAGAGIAISGATISSTHTPIILQLDGTTQSGATTSNFVGNNASFASNVLNISRMAWQDALTLRYSSSASDKNLSQGSAGELLWNGLEVQLRQNAFHQINVAAPLTAAGANIITLDTLWKPSTVTVLQGITSVFNDTLGTLVLGLYGSDSRSELKLVDSQNVVRSLVPSITGTITYNGSTLIDLTYLTSNYSNTTSMNTLLAGKADDAAVTTAFAGVQTQLSGKQDTLTASTGIFMSGSTISSYGLRWNTNSTPSITIEDLHFKTGLTISESLNLSSGKNELVIEHPTSHPISMITGLQAQLDKVSDMIDGMSGLSLGDQGSNAAHRIAAFESHTSGYTYGSYFYGMALFTAPAVGLGIWGGSGAVLPDQTGAGGTAPHMLITTAGNVGIGITNPGRRLHIVGNLLCTGNIVGASKAFDIQHPDPAKPDMRLRHWCVETADSPGGLVMYRRTIDMTSVTATFDMPDWFKHLTKDVSTQTPNYAV